MNRAPEYQYDQSRFEQSLVWARLDPSNEIYRRSSSRKHSVDVIIGANYSRGREKTNRDQGPLRNRDITAIITVGTEEGEEFERQRRNTTTTREEVYALHRVHFARVSLSLTSTG